MGASAAKKRSAFNAAAENGEEEKELSADRDSEVEMHMDYDDMSGFNSRIQPVKSPLGQRADTSDDASNKLIARIAL